LWISDDAAFKFRLVWVYAAAFNSVLPRHHCLSILGSSIPSFLCNYSIYLL